MYYDLKVGSVFLSMNQRADQPWRRDIIVGLRDGTGRRMHIATSGAPTSDFHDTWFARDIDDNVLILNGSATISNASQLLSNCIPNVLTGFQHPEKPLSWNVGGLDSFVLSQRKIQWQNKI